MRKYAALAIFIPAMIALVYAAMATPSGAVTHQPDVSTQLKNIAGPSAYTASHAKTSNGANAPAIMQAAQCYARTAHTPTRTSRPDYGSQEDWATGVADQWCTWGTQLSSVHTQLRTFNRAKWRWMDAADATFTRRNPGGASARAWSHCNVGYGRLRDLRAWETIGYFTFCRFESGLHMKCYYPTLTTRTKLQCVHAT